MARKETQNCFSFITTVKMLTIFSQEHKNHYESSLLLKQTRSELYVQLST